MAIEVEKKFDLTPAEEARLLAGAAFLAEKTFTDIYYDTADYILTREDKWLRERDGKWELKVNRNRSLDRRADQYEEITDENAIRNALSIGVQHPMLDTLSAAGYLSFATIVTTRREYTKGKYTIDLDAVTYPGSDFTYCLAEIEAAATDEAHMDAVLDELLTFIQSEGIALRPIYGKVGAYLRAERPAHYAALAAAGVFRAHRPSENKRLGF